MGTASHRYRSRLLAGVFGAYFALVMVASWMFASRLSSPWFNADLSRWLYTVHIIASSIFLVGFGLYAFVIEEAFDRRVREVNRELGNLLLDGSKALEPEIVIAADPEDPSEVEAEGLDLDVLLETLGEVQTQQVLILPPNVAGAEAVGLHRLQVALLQRREYLKHRQKEVAKFLPGPMVVAVTIFGVSMALLPAAGGMLQTYHQVNTAVILGFAYMWVGLAAYFGVSIAGVMAFMWKERKRRAHEEAEDEVVTSTRESSRGSVHEEQ